MFLLKLISPDTVTISNLALDSHGDGQMQSQILRLQCKKNIDKNTIQNIVTMRNFLLILDPLFLTGWCNSPQSVKNSITS